MKCDTYIAGVDNSDMQAAIWEVLGDNVPEEFAEVDVAFADYHRGSTAEEIAAG